MAQNVEFTKKFFTSKFDKVLDLDMYSCQECEYRSQRKHNLNRHILTKHTPPSNVECKYCKKTYKNIFSIKKHSCYEYEKFEKSLKQSVMLNF